MNEEGNGRSKDKQKELMDLRADTMSCMDL